jgi:hypothetical protein
VASCRFTLIRIGGILPPGILFYIRIGTILPPGILFYIRIGTILPPGIVFYVDLTQYQSTNVVKSPGFLSHRDLKQDPLEHLP